jgi:hypothetical protein
MPTNRTAGSSMKGNGIKSKDIGIAQTSGIDRFLLICARPQGAVDQIRLSMDNRNFKVGLNDQSGSS